MKLKRRAMVLQGGGPTRVINASLAGIIKTSKSKNIQLFGSYHGIECILSQLQNSVFDLSNIPDSKIDEISKSPGAALGSTRKKPSKKECQRIVHSLIERKIDCLFYIGGNDTALSLSLMDSYAKSISAPIIFIHVPKTVDNDLIMNDHTPGYGSAAKYIASLIRGIDLDNSSLNGIYIAVTMGRSSGYLTAASSLARIPGLSNSGPHVICTPEMDFKEEKFLSQIERVYSNLGRAVVVVSEGISTMINGKQTELINSIQQKNGNGQTEIDNFGNVQLSGSGLLADYISNLIKNSLDISRVRADTLGYSQRCFLDVYSEVDFKEAYDVGKRAVDYFVIGGHSASLILIANRNGSYSCDFGFASLTDVAGKVKKLPKEFIFEDIYDIDDSFSYYATPLIGQPLLSVSNFLR